MNKLIIFILTFTLSVGAHSQVNPAPSQPNVLIQILANDFGVKDLVLYSLLAKRCTTYLPSTDQKKCQDSVSEMIRLLDSNILFPTADTELAKAYQPQAFLFVAFKKNLIEILSAPSTTDYLNDLQVELNEYLLGNNTTLNLWDFTLKYYKTQAEAAKVLSALYQDTSLARLHLNFLERARIRGRLNFQENKELLGKLLETLNMITQNQSELQSLLFPKNTKPSLNKNMYHFYVPLYLAQALKTQGRDSYMSYVAPMLMTLTYEFVTSASDYRYMYLDPKTLKSPKYAWKIKDIFAAHQGAAMGAGRKTMKDFSSIQEGFDVSTQSTVKAILAR